MLKLILRKKQSIYSEIVNVLKICLCEFSEMLYCRQVIGAGSRIWITEETKANKVSINSDTSSISIGSLVNRHTLVSSFVVCSLSTVLNILSVCAHTEVIFLVIQAITIHVIN